MKVARGSRGRRERPFRRHILRTYRRELITPIAVLKLIAVMDVIWNALEKTKLKGEVLSVVNDKNVKYLNVQRDSRYAKTNYAPLFWQPVADRGLQVEVNSELRSALSSILLLQTEIANNARQAI
jgi:hypothetical protein